MFFGRETLNAVLVRLSRPKSRSARARQRRKPAIAVQPLEGRLLLSQVGVAHVRHTPSALVAKLDQRHGRGSDDGIRHNALDDKGRHGRGRDNAAGHVVTASSQGRNGKDDPVGHNANDDRGTTRNGMDDPAGHNANDDRGGHGKDDGSGHK